MKKARFTSALIWLPAATLACTVAWAELYKTTDAQGNVTYSDKPQKNAEPVKLPPLNVSDPVTAAEKDKPAPVDADTGYTTLAISSPSAGQVIPNGLTPISVSAQLEPALREGHQLRLLIDGKEHSTGATTQFQVERLDRGNRALQLVVLADGKEIQQSDTVNIFVYWPGNR